MSTKKHGPRRHPARALLDWATTVAGALGAVAVAGMMVHVLAHTGFRWLSGAGLTGTLEYVRFWWLMAMVYGALALAERRGDHIAAPILFERLPPALQKQWIIVGNGITVVVLLLVFWYGWQGALQRMDIGARAAGSSILTWPSSFLVPAGALLYALQLVVNSIDQVREPERAVHEDPQALV